MPRQPKRYENPEDDKPEEPEPELGPEQDVEEQEQPEAYEEPEYPEYKPVPKEYLRIPIRASSETNMMHNLGFIWKLDCKRISLWSF